VSRLTWEGHEFLDAARDEKRWKKAMSTVKEKGGTITIEKYFSWVSLTSNTL
jgi:hypothetical protein